jgi:hypothetical protein
VQLHVGEQLLAEDLMVGVEQVVDALRLVRSTQDLHLGLRSAKRHQPVLTLPAAGGTQFVLTAYQHV